MGLNISHPQIGVDPYFLAKDALKKDRVNLDDEKENTTSSLRNFTFSDFNTPHQKRQLADRQFRVERSIFILEQHIEKKVMSIFFQAIVCFLTKNVFREGHTIHQGYTAKSLHGVKFQAAHSATLPCLFAKQGDTEIVYLYRSGYYDESNATLDVIKAINDADRSIEEKTKDSLLRQKAIALLNLTSVGKITPEEVVTHFVNHLIEEIDKALTREIQSAKGEIDVAKRERILEIIDVLHFYRKKAASLIPFVNQ
ncbi:MAG: XRE family transcriptional regulator, partial [Parachlamydia sp.]